MRPVTRVSIIIVLCMIVSMNMIFFCEDARGEVIPDYDIDVGTTIVHIRHENENIGTFKITIINQCAHTLTIQVDVSGAGVQIAPSVSAVTVGSYESKDLNIALARLFRTPAGVYGVNIHTQVIRVDGGPPPEGRERHASVIVLAHRHHSVSAGHGYVSVVKGNAKSSTISIGNLGNAPDYFGLEFQNAEEVNAYPAVDYIMVPPGENVEYPIIVSVSEKASTGPTSLDYRVYSIIDEGAQTNGTLLVEVVKEKKEENGLQSPIAGLSLAGGLMVFLGFLLYFQHSLNKQDLKKSSPLFSFLVSFLMLSTVLFIAVPPEAGAQVAPDFTISLNPASPLDPSPLTEDEAATGTMMVTIESHSIHEQVVRATIDATGATIGYVMEHRIPPNGEATFPVSIGIEKGSPYGQIQGIIHVEVIEVQGVAVDGGYVAGIGFGVISSPYSLPQISVQINCIDVKKDNAINLVFTIVNTGNAVDYFNLTVEDQTELEEKGFEFSNLTCNESLGVSEEAQINFNVTPTKKLRQEFYVLRALAQGENREEPMGGCTVLLVREESDDDDNGFLPGFEVVMLLAGVVMCTAIVKRRNRIKKK